MQVPALTLIQGVRGTEGLLQTFENALDKNDYVTQTIQWKVEPAAASNSARK